MDNVYESIVIGLAEAIEDEKSCENKLMRNILYEEPIKKSNGEETRILRNKEKRLIKELKDRMTPIIMQTQKDKIK